jgi:hypothetical protein
LSWWMNQIHTADTNWHTDERHGSRALNTDPHLNTCFFRTRYNNMAAATAYYYTLIGLHTRNRCSCHCKWIHATTLSFRSSLTDQYQPRTCFPVTTIHIIIIRFTDDKTQQYLLIATPQQYARIIVLLTVRSLQTEGLHSTGYECTAHGSNQTHQAHHHAVPMSKARSRRFSNTLTAIITTPKRVWTRWTDYRWLKHTYKIFKFFASCLWC